MFGNAVRGSKFTTEIHIEAEAINRSFWSYIHIENVYPSIHLDVAKKKKSLR